MPPEVSVIIPSHNALKTLGLQLEALAKQRNPPEFEILICDNGSDDGTAEWVRAMNPECFSVRYLDAGRHPGAAYARNVGIARARADKLAFCDADDVVSETWVRGACDALDVMPLVNGSAKPMAEEAFQRPLDEIRSVLPLPEAGAPLYPAGQGAVGPALMAGTFAARKEYLIELGGFDASLVHGGEDNDIAFRATRGGYCLMETSEMGLLYRKDPESFREIRKAYFHGRSIALVCARHDLWGRAVPYRQSPTATLFRALLAALLMVVGRKPKDYHGVLSRIANSWGLVDGLVRYRLLRRAPLPAVGLGLQGESGR